MAALKLVNQYLNLHKFSIKSGQHWQIETNTSPAWARDNTGYAKIPRTLPLRVQIRQIRSTIEYANRLGHYLLGNL
jgi:hypothetical protein